MTFFFIFSLFSSLNNKTISRPTLLPRKFYYLDRAQSVGDPDTTYLTVPNIPILTAFSKIRDYGWKKFIGEYTQV